MSLLKVNSLQDLGADAVVTDGVIVSSALPAGSILQVVSTTKTDTFSTTSTSFTDVTGLSASITPSSTSSKILVLVDISRAGNTSSSYDIRFNLLRNATIIGVDGSSTATSGIYANDGTASLAASLSFSDSPATTSTTTYKIQAQVTGGTGFINRNASGTNSYSSTITLMEVAG